MTALTWTAAIVAIIPLVTILAHLLVNGLGKLTPSFFTQLPSPPGVRGGGARLQVGVDERAVSS